MAKTKIKRGFGHCTFDTKYIANSCCRSSERVVKFAELSVNAIMSVCVLTLSHFDVPKPKDLNGFSSVGVLGKNIFFGGGHLGGNNG